MGVISCLLVADASEAQAVRDHDDPAQAWNGVVFRGLDRIKLVALWALVEGNSTEDRFEQRMEMVRTFPESDAGPWVDVAPPALVSALSALAAVDDDEIADLASALAPMEDFEGWESSEIADLVRTIGDQAEAADLQGKTLMIHTTL